MSTDQNIVITSKRDDPFARVTKSMLDDKRLSWKAKGVLSYLLGKPVNWKVRATDIINHGKDGKSAVWTSLKELRTHGYCRVVPIRTPTGTIIEWQWQISDSPIFAKPDTDFQHLDNRYISKNELSKPSPPKKPRRIPNHVKQLGPVRRLRPYSGPRG